MMKGKESINNMQMVFLFFGYLIGSVLIIIPGPLVTMAKNAAWISILIAMAFGILLLQVILYLQRKHAGLTFIGYSRKLVGYWPTVVIAGLMLTMAFHMAAGIFLDVAGFMNSMMMPETPPYVFMGLMFIIAALLLHSGIEAIARIFSILVLIMLLFWFVVLVLLIPSYHPEFLRPILPDGYKPLLLGTYLSFGIPFGEVILFALVLPYAGIKQMKGLNKALVWTMIGCGVVLMLSTVCTIMALGPFAAEKKYSLFTLAQLVEIGDIIERIESISGMTMILGSLMKGTVTLFAIQTIIADVFGIKDSRMLTNPLCLLSMLMAMTLPATMQEWEEMVFVVHPLWVGVVYMIPVLLLAAVTLVRGGLKAHDAQRE
ncbi:GerAB/ArcD/ProY family transporter [Paenibacillus plantiphilus]|nr:endospore germination permease [Paenibacillus plantiphilus]